MMWRGKDVVYNILGYLMFAVPIEMPFIAYHEPRGASSAPPQPPQAWGWGGPPYNARLLSVRAACQSSWGGCCD